MTTSCERALHRTVPFRTTSFALYSRPNILTLKTRRSAYAFCFTLTCSQSRALFPSTAVLLCALHANMNENYKYAPHPTNGGTNVSRHARHHTGKHTAVSRLVPSAVVETGWECRTAVAGAIAYRKGRKDQQSAHSDFTAHGYNDATHKPAQQSDVSSSRPSGLKSALKSNTQSSRVPKGVSIVANPTRETPAYEWTENVRVTQVFGPDAES